MSKQNAINVESSVVSPKIGDIKFLTEFDIAAVPLPEKNRYVNKSEKEIKKITRIAKSALKFHQRQLVIRPDSIDDNAAVKVYKKQLAQIAEVQREKGMDQQSNLSR